MLRCILVNETELTNNTHSLSDIVKIQYSQKLVGDRLTHLIQGNGLWCSGSKYKAKIASCGNQGSFIW